MWGKAFDNYFPADPTARTGPTQNFGSVLYRSEWSVIVSQLGVDSRTTVRRELKRKFDDFIWIPYASDRIWATTPQRGKIWRQLPEGPRVCAPHLYVNPRFAHKHFTLRAASNEIGEDSDVDSTRLEHLGRVILKNTRPRGWAGDGGGEGSTGVQARHAMDTMGRPAHDACVWGARIAGVAQ
ncbi:predicted protein [Postia placenta Mad-698-R]|nr:predicted protein [Postia placenta Mad-698-R]